MRAPGASGAGQRTVGRCLAAALALALAALPGPSALAERSPPAPAPSEVGQDVKADRDGDKVFEDLERRLAKTPDARRLEVIVRLDSPASPARVESLKGGAGQFEVHQRFSVVDGFAATMTKRQVKRLARERGVVHIEEDSVVRAANDAARSSTGVSQAVAQLPSLDGDRDGSSTIYTPWDTVAAVIDSGIDARHVDLDGGKVIAFKDFVNGRISPYDDDGHGTHVAATIAGTGEATADRRYRGVAPGAGLVGVKVLDDTGSGSLSDVTSGVDWAVTNKDNFGIEVINLSVGDDACSNGADLLSQAVNRAHATGLVVTVAAGNSGPGTCTIGSPAAATGALTVGSMADLDSLTRGFALSSFSSRGPTADGRVKPDVLAPGERIASAEADTLTGYRNEWGTSVAAPVVAGVALLMRDANPNLGSQQVKDSIMSTAVDWGRRGDNTAPGSRGPDIDYGAGRLDGYAAIDAAGAGLPGPAPRMPAHGRMEGSLDSVGAEAERQLEVTDISFPVAATLIIPSVTGPQAVRPDFDLYLFGPDGRLVTSSETSSRQEVVTHSPAVTGTYKLRVRSWTGTGSYLVDVSVGGTLAGANLAPRPAGSPWRPLGGYLTSGPDVASWGNGRLDVFVRGGDNQLWHRAWLGSTWSGWSPLGGYLTSDPGVVSWGPNRLDVFVRGGDNQLWHKAWVGSTWSGWSPLGGYLTSGPDVGSWGNGRLDVVVRGGDNQLWHRAWVGSTWTQWAPLGGYLTSDPAAVSWGANRLDVFVRGGDNQLWHRAWVGSTWTQWAPLGGYLTSSPDVASWGPGRLDVFVRGPDNGLHQRSFDGRGWSDWRALGGWLTADPGAVSSERQRIDAFVRGPDNGLYQKSFGTGT